MKRKSNSQAQGDLFAWADNRPSDEAASAVEITRPMSWSIAEPAGVVIQARKKFQRRTNIFAMLFVRGLFVAPKDAGQIIHLAERRATVIASRSGGDGPRPDRRAG